MPNYLPITPQKVWVVTVKSYSPFGLGGVGEVIETKVFANKAAAIEYEQAANSEECKIADYEGYEIDYKGY